MTPKRDAYRCGKTIKIITDPDGTIIHVSSAFCDVFGFREEDVEGLSVSMLRHPKISSSFYEAIWEALEKGEVCYDTMLSLDINGDEVWSRGSVYCVCNSAGKIVAYCSERLLCSALEISQAKRVMEELFNEDISHLD